MTACLGCPCGYPVNGPADVVGGDHVVQDHSVADLTGQLQHLRSGGPQVDRDVPWSDIAVGHVQADPVQVDELAGIADFLHAEQAPDGLDVFPHGLQGTVASLAYP